MAVWISQLIGDTVEEQISALCIQIHSKVLEYVHVRGMGNSTHGWSQTFGSQILNCGSSDVHNQGINQLNVVPVAGRLAV